jgi:ketosteroid isomerase-like protein
MRIKQIFLLPLVPTVVAAATLSGLAQGREHSKSDDVRKAIEHTEERFSSLFSIGDIRSLSELYTEDAQVMAPNTTTVNGRAAIRSFWQSAREAGVKKLDVKTMETSGTGGDTTYETGTYVLYSGTGDVVDEGKYVVIWRRDGKSWYLYRDIWNSNRK